MELTAIDDAIKCPICLNKYSKPITLPCGETICMEHLSSQSWTKDKKFKCDVCNNLHGLPDDGKFLLLPSFSQLRTGQSNLVTCTILGVHTFFLNLD